MKLIITILPTLSSNTKYRIYPIDSFEAFYHSGSVFTAAPAAHGPLHRVTFTLFRRRKRSVNLSEVYKPAVWPLAAFFILVVLLVIFILAMSFVLGQRHRSRTTEEIFECGLVSTGSARVRFAAKFYLMAMFFVIFDLESVFILVWSVGVRELGWIGFLEVAVFVGILLAALFYLWRVGALDWGTLKQKKDAQKLRRRRLV
jgi:NADH-quinone oxidoreductase subunit A